MIISDKFDLFWTRTLSICHHKMAACAETCVFILQKIRIMVITQQPLGLEKKLRLLLK
jgi:hypothetical protein